MIQIDFMISMGDEKSLHSDKINVFWWMIYKLIIHVP